MMVNILPSDSHKTMLAFLDFVEEEPKVYDETQTLPSIGLCVFTKNVSTTKKIRSFKNIYEEIKEEINKNHIPFGEIYVPSNQLKAEAKKIELLIQAASNVVASKGRRGPANFVILNEEMLKRFQRIHLKSVIDNSLKNEIIVGRKGAADEPGIVLVTHENLYKITTTGNNPECQYVKIDVDLY